MRMALYKIMRYHLEAYSWCQNMKKVDKCKTLRFRDTVCCKSTLKFVKKQICMIFGEFLFLSCPVIWYITVIDLFASFVIMTACRYFFFLKEKHGYKHFHFSIGSLSLSIHCKELYEVSSTDYSIQGFFYVSSLHYFIDLG